jgi:hypothetical protein
MGTFRQPRDWSLFLAACLCAILEVDLPVQWSLGMMTAQPAASLHPHDQLWVRATQPSYSRFLCEMTGVWI